MKPILFALGTLVLVSSSAFARLGETEEDLAARYGQPTSKPIDLAPAYQEYLGIASEHAPRTLTYKKDGFSIEVCFIGGHSERETLSRQTTDLSLEETQQFLDLNARGAQWKVVRKRLNKEGGSIPVGWELNQGSAFAEVKEGALSIYSQKFKELEAKQNAEAAPKFSEGPAEGAAQITIKE